jgi:hypothetical protein
LEVPSREAEVASTVMQESDIPKFLVDRISGFSSSPEYESVDRELRHLPGIVVGQFKNYVLRLEATQDASYRGLNELAECYDAIEVLASSSEPTIRNWVVVDVFEHLWCPDDVRDRFVKNLGPASRSLLAKWRSEP